jgi:DNA-binding MarR family transcriptional regulator
VQQRIRLTTTTLAVLNVLMAATTSGEPAWGFRICEQAGLGPGTVYPILDRLERNGWLSGSWEADQPAGRPRRRFYEMTAIGRAEFAAAAAARPHAGKAFRHLAWPGSPA